MKKGITLASESIVVIILAVIVLAALLAFLSSVSGPTQDEVRLRLRQAQQCRSYVEANGKCERSADSRVDSDLKRDLVTTCTSLKYARCTGSDSIACVIECCSGYCPARPKCEDLGGSCASRCNTELNAECSGGQRCCAVATTTRS